MMPAMVLKEAGGGHTCRRWSILGCLWEGVCAMPAQVLKGAGCAGFEGGRRPMGGGGGWWRGARGDAEGGREEETMRY